MTAKDLAKRTLRPVYRGGRQRLIRLLLKALSSMDDSFALNLQRSRALPESGNGKTSAAGLEPALQPEPTHARTVVANDKAPVSTVELLDLCLEAMLSSASLRESIREELQTRDQTWESQEALQKEALAIVERLFRDAKARSPRRAELAAALAELAAHEQATDENQRCYLTEGRAFPNAVFWPDPTHEKGARSVFDEVPMARRTPIIDRATPIGSAGSCFAIEIAHRLQADGYNYVVTEHTKKAGEGPSDSCARWGIIFNTPSFRQLVEQAFGLRELPRVLWSLPDKGGTPRLYDPFREDVIFDSVEQWEQDRENHVKAAREAFLKAKVFVFTLGMTEAWYLRGSGAFLSRSPWRIAANLIARKSLTVADGLSDLQRMLDILRAHNRDLELIVSVSPVPLHATYRGEDAHVIAANSLSKSTLRVTAEEFCARNKGVHYFPSFESVMYCTRDAWQPDQRHVSREAVGKVMKLFEGMFLKS